ncbi:hypothetical protein [Paludisphaera borealis]|uniref:hypothetical protein n=1 Tax=Paludisphaera borealis TaxID=1387353 RepID=UPI00143CDF69|nr:hypothetical protein [Paludisphaera borealis]
MRLRQLDRAINRGQRLRLASVDRSISETWVQRQGSAFNGHIGCVCGDPLFVFSSFGDPE